MNNIEELRVQKMRQICPRRINVTPNSSVISVSAVRIPGQLLFSPNRRLSSHNASNTQMSVHSYLPALLETLIQSVNAASEAAKDKASAFLHLRDGISLLDVKNELFLSYLQNLVFLILLKVRHSRGTSKNEDGGELSNLVMRKLHELSIYVDKGVLSLEKDLKYQIDKVIRAAEDAKIAADRVAEASRVVEQKKKSFEHDSDAGNGSDAESEEGEVTLKASEIDDLQYRPNPAALIRPSVGGEAEDSSLENGVYRPPRIQATAMPVTERHEKEARKPNKSATLDEFISTELSTAPLAEPSIGSGLVEGGRRSKSEKEKRDEKERIEYEEGNYVRLPKETKKEQAKKGGRKDAGYGGEEWRDLGEGINRIDRLTKRKGGAGRNVLEKSRKRSTEDGPRGIGMELGSGLQKRLKTGENRRKDRGRK